MSCCQPNSQYSLTPAIGKLDAPKRNHYYFSKLMDVLQFEMEQSYANDKRWLLNRLSLGTGVLCGLDVVVDKDRLCIMPGVAIDSFGHEVIVPGRYCLDPWLLPDECGKPKHELSRRQAHRVTICLGYRECLADQAPVLVTDCRSEQLCEAGSVVESFNLWVREGWPASRPGLCEALEKPLQGADGGYRVVATIDVGGRPIAAAVAASGKRALILNDIEKPTLQVIDVVASTVIHTLGGVTKHPLGGASVAPDGGAVYVTHGDGLISVDLDSATPTSKSIVTDRTYGACAACNQGKRVFAINTKQHQVEAIDVDTGKAHGLKLGKGPFDLAVASDSAMLFVADNAEHLVYAVDTATLKVLWKKPLKHPCQTLAATGAGAGSESWSAAKSEARRFDVGGQPSDLALNLEPRDSAFTSNGARYYVADAGSQDQKDAIVVYEHGSSVELARLPVGAGVSGVAIVPTHWRALITALDGSVTVIDVASLRDRLCHALRGPCPEPDKHPCIELATVLLRADGTIGEIDRCTHRTRLLSNELLLELILCLADKMEACCDGHAPPKPEDPPPHEDPPPEVATIKVTGVEFIDMQGQKFAEMPNPGAPISFKEANNINQIRISFDRPVGKASVVTGGFGDDPKTYSLLVEADWSSQPLKAVAGKVAFDTPSSLVYTIAPDPRRFQKGNYKLTLFGNVDPTNTRPTVKSASGGLLDGEPLAFPSGNNAPGGNFFIKFVSL